MSRPTRYRYVERCAPHMLEELRGMAEGSGIPVEDLMLLQVRNQLLAESDSGCTSFSIAVPTRTPTRLTV